MGKDFNLTGYPDVLPNSGQDLGAPDSMLATGLADWYRGTPKEDVPIEGCEPKPPKKIKSVLKGSLQIVAVVLLVIAAGILGGFVFLDRKINLESTQASLHRISDLLVQEGGSNAAVDVSDSDLEGQDSVSPQIQGDQEARVFNSSGNTNVAGGSLSAGVDSDQDGLSDEVEEKLGTNPFQKDTDGDGYPDGTEVENGYDPLAPAAQSGSTVSSLGSTASLQVASTSSYSVNSETSQSSCGSPQTSFSTGGNIASQDYDFSGLSADDYTALSQFGLSSEDVDRAASGQLGLSDKFSLQEKIVASPAMQGTIGDMLESIPKASLPNISDSELNLVSTNSREDIQKYLAALDQALEDNLGGIVDINRASFKNELLNGNYSGVGEINQAFQKTYAAVKALPTPYDAKEVQKSFLIMLRLYMDLMNEQNAASQDPDRFAAVVSEVKSFEDLTVMMQQAFSELNEKYDLD